MTKTAFLKAYRNRLWVMYAWANDNAKLDRFMSVVAHTLVTASNQWDHSGPAVIGAWRDIGGKGKPTLKALRALPMAEGA